jgi:formylglycine-generating enzyme required for sulfatase activity
MIRLVGPGDTAFFYFSGYGMTFYGDNYVLPADAPDIAPGEEARLKDAALRETYIDSALTGRGVRAVVVVLDACHTNPFARSGKGVDGESMRAPPPRVKGVFSLYATSGYPSRDQLYDGDPDPNSLFVRVLVPLLKKSELEVGTLAREVSEEVERLAQAASFAQRPAYYAYHGLTLDKRERVYLVGPPLPPGGSSMFIPPAASAAASVWSEVKGTTSIAVLDIFIGRFGNVPVYGPLARVRREELAKKQAADVIDPVQPLAPLTPAQERDLKPGDSFRECENCPEMVVVPAGSFTMGSPAGEKDRESNEGPQHVVTISRLFAAGRLHVTVDQFAAFVGDTGYEATSTCRTFEDSAWVDRIDRSWRRPGFIQEGSQPVICVGSNDAKAYVDWLAQKSGKPYRLLSEAEWEYAARGRTQPGAYPRFWFGENEKDLCRYGNSADRTSGRIPGWHFTWQSAPCDDGYGYTAPAGRYVPNAFGLHDMSGNAYQWTADCWHGDYKGAPADGSAWTTGCRGNNHVARGGAWASPPQNLRSARRLSFYGATGDFGFRVARTLTP